MALSLVFVAACDGNSLPSARPSSGGSTTSAAGSPSNGAPSSAGKTAASGGVANGAGGSAAAAANTAGSATGGHPGGGAGAPHGDAGTSAQAGGGGTPETAGSGGTPETAGSGGTPETAGSGGALGNGGMGGGASGAPSSGGAPTTDNGGSGDTGDASCSRDLLKSTVSAYFTALAAHDPSSLPLADNVKFTENGQATTVGTKGLWTTAGAVKGSFSALDTDTCNAATQAVVPDGSTDIPFALRLKLENQKITEIETIAVRAGDYKVSGSSFASDTNALLQSVSSVHWEDPVPAGMQNTRDEISAWVDKYFRDFPNGVCNTTQSCKRLENGGGSFSCSAGASCMMGAPSGKPAITPRLILVDVESGLGVGYDLFEGADDDTHMFKMYGGQVYAVSAILGAAGSSGWD
jgi:hypothetical protein